MIAAARYFFSEAFLSLWRGRRASALAVVTIAIALFVLGVFLVLTANLERVVSRWSAAAEFSVYLEDGIDDAAREAVARAAAAHPGVSGTELVTKTDALQRFGREFPEFAAAATRSPANPFPASIEVRLKSAGARTADLEALARDLAKMPGVADVRYDRRWIERLTAAASGVRWAGYGLSAVLILAAALTITIVVRLATHARRDEIEIMELVGAPLSFIRGPFICEGIVQGTLGAAVALVLLRVSFAALGSGLDRVTRMAGAEGAVFLAPSTVLAVVVGGALVGCVAGLLGVSRFRP